MFTNTIILPSISCKSPPIYKNFIDFSVFIKIIFVFIYYFAFISISIRCYFAGAPISTEDSEYQQILSKIREYGLEENVFLLGNVSDVPSLLAKADVFVVPSRFEGFGIVAVEAAAAGIPCVASNIDGLAEVVNDKRLGCLFEVGNAEALAKAIDSVASNISEFNPNWIRENAYNRFSIQVMTSALLNVYKG